MTRPSAGNELFELSGRSNEVFIPLQIIKTAGTIGDLLLALKRIGHTDQIQ